MGLMNVARKGKFAGMSTRNNNFSNRDMRMNICVKDKLTDPLILTAQRRAPGRCLFKSVLQDMQQKRETVSLDLHTTFIFLF